MMGLNGGTEAVPAGRLDAATAVTDDQALTAVHELTAFMAFMFRRPLPGLAAMRMIIAGGQADQHLGLRRHSCTSPLSAG